MKTLEELENKYWGNPDPSSSKLVQKCHELRRKPIDELDIEDVRLLISQEIGLKYSIPLAMDILEKDILAEGDYYEGDLLKAVLSSNPDEWENTSLIDRLEGLFEGNKDNIQNADLTDDIKGKIIDSYEAFKSKLL